MLQWREYFMSIAKLSALRSKDPNTQVGACIVNDLNRIVGIGYNGFPTGCADDQLSWEKPEKLLYVVHAEANAILNKNIADIRGCTLYVTLFPCNECAKLIIQSGISAIVYEKEKNHDTPAILAAKKMFDMIGIHYEKYEGSNTEITLIV
jgi:dCMP deaminase